MRSLSKNLTVLGDWGITPSSEKSKTWPGLPCLRVCEMNYRKTIKGNIYFIKKRV